VSRGIRARGIRAIVFASIALLAWLIPAGVASAHANLDRSDPADGQQLNTAPSRVSLTFTETPDPELSSVTVLDAGGSEVQAGPAQPTPGDPKTLVAPLPRDLPDGVYTVSWRMVSEEDGHTTAGALAFGVGVSPATAPRPPAAPTTPRPSPLGVAGKVLLYAGLALLLAAAVVGIGAFGGAVPARWSVLVLSSGTAAIGVVLMTLAESRTVGVGIGDLLGSHTGELYVLLLVAVGTAMVLALVASFIGGRVTLALGGLGAAAVMVVRADGGHAAASTDLPLIQVGLQSLHFAAVGVWIGGLALLALLLHSRKGREAPEREARRFSFLAGICLAAVIATGALREVNELGGLGAVLHIFRTSYGTTLAIKAVVAAILIGLGATNRYRSIPRMRSDGGDLLRRVLAGELVAAVTILGLTGVLTSFPPQPAKAASQRPTELTATASDFATTMTVRVTASPGTPGRNHFQVRVEDYDSAQALPVDEVSLRFASVSRPDVGASSLKLSAGPGASWQAEGTELSIPGVWRVTALVQAGAEATEIPLVLTVPNPEAKVTVSRAEGQPDLYTIALAGGVELQAYTDPGVPGPNQLHLTAFGADGDELPLASATAIAVPPAGSPVPVDLLRFSPGHFAGNLDLEPVAWTFAFVAKTRDGGFLMASFSQTIAAE